MERQRMLLSNLESQDDAYERAIQDCQLPVESAQAVALWLLHGGERCASADGDSCRRVKKTPMRLAASQSGATLGSFSRGLKRLIEEGLVVETLGYWVLNVSRCVALAETRATDELDVIEFDRGWQPRKSNERDRESESVPPCSTVFHDVPPRSTRSRTEKEETIHPEYRIDTEFGSGHMEQSGTRRNKVERGGTARDVRQILHQLNSTAAWQRLQQDDFTRNGSRQVPQISKLKACFDAAVDLGLFAADYDDKRAFLATVHDCAFTAKTNPAGALAWRVAAGKIWKCSDESNQWAKRVLRPAELDRDRET